VPTQQKHCPWVVIDGYLRISAAKALGQDAICASAWELEASQALIYLYRNHSKRPWVPLEEAYLVQELMTSNQYSQSQLAKSLGKSAAWVSHRLQLIHSLPEFAIAAVHHGHLTSWSASRVLVPFARANEQHAKQFTDYLIAHPHSSRDIHTFFENYMRSNRQVREKMVAQPQLFFKSLTISSKHKKYALLPEEIWEQKLAQIVACSKILEPLLPTVFYSGQEHAQRMLLEEKLVITLENINELHHAVRRINNAHATINSNSTAAAPGRKE
jgi:ParB/RepB/Spo0J family partition protein